MKDFYNIAMMSAKFKAFEESILEQNDDNRVRLHVWQMRIQLAIAQQLSVISASLLKIVGKAEKLNDQDRDGSGKESGE